MQHPLEIGAHYYPPDVHPDQRSHRYRSFMIEEILTDHPDHKVSSPTGDLLKFGVHALLSARPYHNHLGKNRDLWVRQYFEIRHGQSFNLNLLLIQGIQISEPLYLPTQREKTPHYICRPIQSKSDISHRNICNAVDRANARSVQAPFLLIWEKLLLTTAKKPNKKSLKYKVFFFICHLK